jgi:hypothetical protein
MQIRVGVEEYARRHGKIHPVLAEKLARFFAPLGWDVNRCKVRISDVDLGRFALRRGGATAVYVKGDVITAINGCLNSREPVRNNSWDLARAGGFSTFAHECFHCYQWQTRGWTWPMKIAWQSMVYWLKGDLHKAPFELEAIAFQKQVSDAIRAEPKFIAELDEYRGGNG